MADLRLFVAVEMPDAVTRLLAAVQRDLERSRADVKWSRREQMHLTLKFLGDTPEEEVPRLKTLLDTAAADSRPSVARLAQVGVFPDLRRPRVIWAGLEEHTGKLLDLQKRVDQALAPFVEPDPRGFTPHLTLGRVRTGRHLDRLRELLTGYRLQSQLEVPIRRLTLFHSTLAPSGPTYTPLHHASLPDA